MNISRKFKFVSVISLALLAACGSTSYHDPDVVNRASTNLNYRDTIAPPVETPMNAYLTGYSYWDNTPRGSAQIARPVIHRSAGGIGTYSDPITLAVGHVKNGGRSIMDYPAGTRFYIKRLRKYAIVEDLCGDGNRPQDGPCHSGHRGHDWIDIYVGGRRMAEAAVDACMRHITGIQPVILNPQPGHPVEPGEIASTDCRKF